MSAPTLNTVHINKPLTQISVAFAQDDKQYIADKIFPIVPVDKSSDLYFRYNKDTFLRAIAAERSGATESEGSGYGLDTAFYSCKQKSLHKDIPRDVAANTDAPLNADRDATEFVTAGMLRRRELDFAGSYCKAGVWTNQSTLAGATQWSDPASDPQAAVKAACRSVQLSIAMKPNKMIIGPYVLDALSQHPKLKEQYKYTTSESLTVEMISRILDIEIVVGEAVWDSSKEGATYAGQFVYGKHATLVYAAPRPSLYMPSAGYIFTWSEFNNKFGIKIDKFQIREKNSVTRVEGDMAYDTKVVAPDAGFFFENAVA